MALGSSAFSSANLIHRSSKVMRLHVAGLLLSKRACIDSTLGTCPEFRIQAKQSNLKYLERNYNFTAKAGLRMSLAAELPIFQACPWQHGNQGLCIYSLRKSVIAWYCHCKSLSYMVSHIIFVRYNVAKASYVMSYVYVF